LDSLFWTDSREWVWATALQFRANLSLEAASSVKQSPTLAVTATKQRGHSALQRYRVLGYGRTLGIPACAERSRRVSEPRLPANGPECRIPSHPMRRLHSRVLTCSDEHWAPHSPASKREKGRSAPRKRVGTPTIPGGGVRGTGTGPGPDVRSGGRDYIIPMPPMSPPPPAGGSFSFSGISVTKHSVVISRPATEAEFCRAARVTLVGSMMPASSMSTYSPV